MVLLHGIGMDWRVWQAISRRLHPHFGLFMLDLRGHGSSAKPPTGYTLADYSADVEDVLDELNLTGAVLVGSSLGGMVGVVLEAPADVVSHRVLVDPPLTGGPVRDVAQFRRILELKHAPVAQLATFLGFSNRGAGQFYLTTMSEMWHETSDGVLLELLAASETFFAVDAGLSAIDAPVLLLQADPARGGVLTDSQAEHALSLLPRGILVRVDGAGHAIHAHQPERFVQLALEFCRMSSRGVAGQTAD